MILWFLLVFLIVWVLCGWLAYGFTLGFWSTAYPEQTYNDRGVKTDTSICIGAALMGPIGLLVNFIEKENTHPRWDYPTKAECNSKNPVVAFLWTVDYKALAAWGKQADAALLVIEQAREDDDAESDED